MHPSLARVFLIRHATTPYNLEHRIQGSLDIPLDERGRLEAKDNLPLLADVGIRRIISSPLKRAYETAAIYAHGLDVPLHVDPRLRELDHGEWEGHRFDELLAAEPSRLRMWLTDPTAVPIPGGSETVDQARQRVVRAIAEITTRYTDETVLVVLHKHIRKILTCALTDMDLCFARDRVDSSTTPAEIPHEQLTRLLLSDGPRTLAFEPDRR